MFRSFAAKLRGSQKFISKDKILFHLLTCIYIDVINRDNSKMETLSSAHNRYLARFDR
jgi:hypothetical protein